MAITYHAVSVILLFCSVTCPHFALFSVIQLMFKNIMKHVKLLYVAVLLLVDPIQSPRMLSNCLFGNLNYNDLLSRMEDENFEL